MAFDFPEIGFPFVSKECQEAYQNDSVCVAFEENQDFLEQFFYDLGWANPLGQEKPVF